MNNKEAVNWLINISADIGKAEHSDLWHYEQTLTEIKDMLESAQPVVPDTNVGNMSEFPTDSTLQPTCNQLATDCVSRQAVKDLLIYNWDECCSACIGEVEEMPSVTQELLYRGAISLDKQEILQAGYEGREYNFYIGGRLFSIREKAQ